MGLNERDKIENIINFEKERKKPELTVYFLVAVSNQEGYTLNKILTHEKLQRHSSFRKNSMKKINVDHRKVVRMRRLQRLTTTTAKN